MTEDECGWKARGERERSAEEEEGVETVKP